MYVVGCAPVAALVLVAHPLEEQRAVVEGDDPGDGVGIELAALLRPRDELEGRAGLHVAADYPGEAEWKILDGGGESDASRVWGKASGKNIIIEKKKSNLDLCIYAINVIDYSTKK